MHIPLSSERPQGKEAETLGPGELVKRDVNNENISGAELPEPGLLDGSL